MKYFVKENSIVREIWGNGDVILFIFTGASAEFALNKAVDWLYFTGKLPADPLGRLFSTVEYARKIVFSEYKDALKSIDIITKIHQNVEEKRGHQIPDWAYKDVLFMLIDYSIRSFEILERILSYEEKNEVFEVFNNVGLRMSLIGLPNNYKNWLTMRESYLQNNLHNSDFTKDLYKQYRKHLGFIRFSMLKQAQLLTLPKTAKNQLNLGEFIWLKPILFSYKVSKRLKINSFFRDLILPTQYKNQIKELDVKVIRT